MANLELTRKIKEQLNNISDDDEEYSKLRYEYIKSGEGYKEKSYIDTTGNVTVGYGFNMDASRARDEWKNAFAKENLEVQFDDVYNGKRILTKNEGEILFNYSINQRAKEIIQRYGNETWDKLNWNEKLAIEDAYYNCPSLVSPKTQFYKHIKDYVNTEDQTHLNKALNELRYKSNKQLSKGLDNRREAEAEMLNTYNISQEEMFAAKPTDEQLKIIKNASPLPPKIINSVNQAKKDIDSEKTYLDKIDREITDALAKVESKYKEITYNDKAVDNELNELLAEVIAQDNYEQQICKVDWAHFNLGEERKIREVVEKLSCETSVKVDNKYLEVNVHPYMSQFTQSLNQSTAHLQGVANYGSSWLSTMPTKILNGDGYSNTIPSYFVTNGYRPGAHELSESNIFKDIREINPYKPNSELKALLTYGEAKKYVNIDPVILDLKGNGLKLKSFLDSDVVFDINDDGYLEQTGWIGEGMGLLVFDRDQDGQINSMKEIVSEHFLPGKKLKDGFEVLKFLDQEGKGIITPEHEYYSKFAVWIDTNCNGKVDEGELKTLAELGITELHMGYNKSQYPVTKYSKNSNDELAGNDALLVGTFIMNGEEHRMYDVNFKANPVGGKIVKNLDGTIVTATEKLGSAYKVENDNDNTLDLRNKPEFKVAIGGRGNDILMANNQGNWLFGNEGKNIYYGGYGDDIFVLSENDNYKDVHGGKGFNTVIMTGQKGHYFDMTKSEVQAIYGSDYGDVIIGNKDKNSFIKGGNGGNILVGGNANDVINAGNGGDYIYGGNGNNILRGGLGNDHIYGGTGNNYIECIAGDNVVLGGPKDDAIVKGKGHDFIDGGGGINSIVFHGSYQEYNYWFDAKGFMRIDDKIPNRDGTSSLMNAHQYVFDDVTLYYTTLPGGYPRDYVKKINGNEHVININSAEIKGNAVNPCNAKIHVSNITEVVGGRVECDYYQYNINYINKYDYTYYNAIGNIRFYPDQNFKGIPYLKYSLTDDAGDTVVLDLSTTGESSLFKSYIFFAKDEYPTDPGFYKQWYLSKHNIIPVWKDYTGKDIKINIVEDGCFDFNHFDLAPNVNEEFLNSNNAKLESIKEHTTKVAGIIAAARNGEGTVGIAYDSIISSENANEGKYINNYSKYDVVNHSFAYNIPFYIGKESLKRITMQELTARDGLGVTLVFGAGNEREENGDSNTCVLRNSIFSVSVGAINRPNDIGILELPVTPFSSKGSNILVSAMGSLMKTTSNKLVNEEGIEFGKDITSNASGTSFAAPVVTGIVALMLEANPNLSVSDIQKILAYSAKYVDGANSAWKHNGSFLWNNIGMHYNNDYGFGEVDAYTAVKLAEKWTGENIIKDYINYVGSKKIGIGKNLQTINEKFYSQSITMSDKNNINIEKVMLDFTAKCNLGDIKITLVSPSGTESVLIDRLNVTEKNPGGYDSFYYGLTEYSLSSNHFMGEKVNGEWKLNFYYEGDIYPAAIGSVSLQFYGNRGEHNEIMVFTDEIHNMYPGGISINKHVETINLSALSGNHRIDLGGGNSASNFGGKHVMIDKNANIKNVVGGDGNDTIVGNLCDNILIGGKGNNGINGISGHNILCGRTGNNQLHSGSDADMFVIWKNDGCKDTIYNFKPKLDKEVINIVHIEEINSFDDLNISEDYLGACVKFANQEIFLPGIKKSDLSQDNFKFDDQYDFFAEFDPNHLNHIWNEALVNIIYG